MKFELHIDANFEITINSMRKCYVDTLYGKQTMLFLACFEFQIDAMFKIAYGSLEKCSAGASYRKKTVEIQCVL